MGTPYLDLAGFKLRTVIPSADVDLVETASPGFVEARIAIWQSELNGRLSKLYAIPFASPVPEIVLGWLTACVTPDVYRKRGMNPTSGAWETAEADRKDALEKVKEAADAHEGRFELPLREDLPSTSGINHGGPLGYSETSPYVWATLQEQAARDEDAQGSGTGP